ncbi:hypothetical protein CROQUDRAFT_54071 [Cronartium quercuum f. sp. fusiforme G11]|uniref:Aprataxin C2HE/C2H2/C2HC zinc finger domain-containing protein n=1 Tax=Cronartium quercuum f. sp. fusiforme G11 TaxID=708437 RepID=A0A9P6N5T0_9BASI|nr:hypothetical protein CROQUDRAFT_54071 [Cronartium quercuum f. sp. fusiforme G11]
MLKTEGRVWPIHLGFHASESMTYISDCLRHKRHYNTFRFDLGFFLHLDDLIQKIRGGVEPATLMKPKAEYELMLKTDLECPKTKARFRTIPSLKAHLLTQWKSPEERND